MHSVFNSIRSKFYLKKIAEKKMFDESNTTTARNNLDTSKSTYNKKKSILNQQRIIGSLSVVFGLIGFILMICENEFIIHYFYDKVNLAKTN